MTSDMAPDISFASRKRQRRASLAADTRPSIPAIPIDCSPAVPQPVKKTIQRHFFFETIRPCDHYSVVHVVVLPPFELATRCACHQEDHEPVNPSDRLFHALREVGCASINLDTTSITVFTGIFPIADGFVSRSDFLSLRLQDCPIPIAHIHELLEPLQKYTAVAVDRESGLLSLVKHAAGIIQWDGIDNSISIAGIQDRLWQITEELKHRLGNAPWLSSRPIAPKRIALVRGRPNLTAGGPVYRAAAALGINLVVISEEGHWLQPETDENKRHREAFIPTDMTEDDGVADRFVAAVKSYPLPIDGIFTLSDNFFVAVAKAAETLGIPTSPVSAYETSVDKFRSRLLQDEPGKTARVTSVAELEELLQKPGQFSSSFPMIVKPTKGWSSECVSKARTLEDLRIAVEKATARHGSAAVIEPFFDGPEIDVNFVLLDGEVLFCEIADEPPCQADARNASVNDTFSPEALTLPSALPLTEQEIAKTTLRNILVKLGFRTGIFHVEARMVNSSCEYCDIGGGVIDLIPKKTLPLGEPVCRLLEINARPPGFRVTVASKQAYGVDYFAVQMLAAVGDSHRLKMMVPFHFDVPGWTAGSQYWSRLLYVPVPADGRVSWVKGLSPCNDLKRRRPDLAARMAIALDYCEDGQIVTQYVDGVKNYAANILVCSRKSRCEAIEMGNEVLRSFEMRIEAEMT